MTQESLSLILRPSKSSAIWLLIGCALFVVGGIWMAQEKGWIGYLSAGLFALGIPIGIIQLLPGSTYLCINEDRLSFANLFRVTHIPWNVIDHFFVVSMNQTGMTVHKIVGFNFVPSYDRASVGRQISSAIAQCEGALPSTYGRKAEELTDMLNRHLSEFTQKTEEQTNERESEQHRVFALLINGTSLPDYRKGYAAWHHARIDFLESLGNEDACNSVAGINSSPPRQDSPSAGQPIPKQPKTYGSLHRWKGRD